MPIIGEYCLEHEFESADCLTMYVAELIILILGMVQAF